MQRSLKGWWVYLVVMLLAAGCVGPRPLTGTSEPSLPVQLFDVAGGRGAVSIRIVDARIRPQALPDATSDTSFNAVAFRLHNAAKLKSPLIKTVASSPAHGGEYAAVFTDLPADGSGGYYLTVGLFRNITTPTSLTDPGYADLRNKVGEGGSTSFAVLPGATATAVVTINAVGDLVVDSQQFVVDPVTPVVYQGDSKVFVDTRVSAAKSPLIQQLELYVLDAAGTSTISSVVAPYASWSASPGATISFNVPALPANYQVCVEAEDAGEVVLSRRYRAFSVASPAVVGFNGGQGVPMGISTAFSTMAMAAGTLATQWSFSPDVVAVDAPGNVYLGDKINHVVWKVASPSMAISVVAGNGANATAGDGGRATAASLQSPSGLAFDGSGNLYIADETAHVIRRVDVSGTIERVAGTIGTSGFTGDAAAATSAKLSSPCALACFGGQVYVADRGNNRVRSFTPGGNIVTYAGDGTGVHSGEGSTPVSAGIGAPTGLGVDASGNLYIACGTYRVRRIASGVITTVAGNGTNATDADGNNATLTAMRPHDVKVDGAGNLIILEKLGVRVRKVDAGSSLVSTVTGTGSSAYGGDGGVASSGLLNTPNGVALWGGQVYVADTGNLRVRRVAGGIIDTIAGNGYPSVFGTTDSNMPRRALFDPAGGLLVADGTCSHRVLRFTPDASFSAFAGSGLAGVPTNGVQATAASMTPSTLARDAAGNVYLGIGAAVYGVAAGTGVITRVAGSGGAGDSGDGGDALLATFTRIRGLACDGAGRVYVADADRHRVRRFTVGGTIEAFAGTGTPGFSGDGGAATAAQLFAPYDVAVDALGAVYIADTHNHRIRKVDAAGLIASVAGTGSTAHNGDQADPLACNLALPVGLAIGAAGEVYFTELIACRVRRLDSAGVTTVAGNGTVGYAGDNGSGPQASIQFTWGLAAHPQGGLVLLDAKNGRMRWLK